MTKRQAINEKATQLMTQLTGKENIQQALLRLMETEPFAKITVKELATEAHISRTSFYRHYDTQQDVLADIIGSADELDHLVCKL